jgi:penicillin-binding protein 2
MRNPFEVYTSLTGGKKKRPLDWDESAADSQSFMEGVFDSDRSAPALGWLWVLIIAVFAVIFGRVFYLQILHGQQFRLLSENNRVRSRTILAPRGKITDKNGKVLAQNTASFNLVATPFDMPKQGLSEEVSALAQDFNLSATDTLQAIIAAPKNSIQPVVILQDVDLQHSILFETKAAGYPGFSMQKIPIRDYADAPAFSNILGYTGLLSPGDLSGKNQDRYDAVDYIGKLGIEKQYEDYLHGQNGENLVEVDATGKLLDVLGENPPQPGNTLVLNIDKDLQEKLYQGLLANSGSKRGAAIAINPKNGQVLALVSSPGFDNNLFAHGISQTDYQGLLNDKSQPLFDRAIGGTYPPGSTSKLMTATAGLQEGVIDQNTIVVDRGLISVPNQFGNTAAYEFHGWKPGGLGAMNVRSAIAMSSDIFFYEVAGGSPNGSMPGLGADRLAEYFRKFGLGKPTGIDIAGEKGGLVPDPAWKMKYFNNDPLLGKWYLGDTYHMGIGQGDLLVTPLQVAEWTAIIADGGIGYVPEIANEVLDQNNKTLWQNQPKVLVKDIASSANIKIVQEGMRQTVLAGTAKSLLSLPISSAGKTGTSQFDGSNPNRTHAWFTSYAPYEDPQIVITVLVEAGGEGNAAALPIAKDALQWWATNRYKKNN